MEATVRPASRWEVLRLSRQVIAAVLVAGGLSVFAGCGAKEQGGPNDIRPRAEAIPSETVTGQVPATPRPETRESDAEERDRALATALLRRAASVADDRGTARIAVWPSGWPKPAFAGNDLDRPFRLWSTSKAVTAVAVEREPALRNMSDVATALRGAIVRSENCRQRRVVLALQKAHGGPEGAESAFLGVLREAGAGRAETSGQRQPPDPSCRDYLAQFDNAESLMGPAAMLGTATWTISDAIAFTHSLADERFDEAGRSVLALMGVPKEQSRELTRPEDFTAAVTWGAGDAFAGQDVAYKAGWGGAAAGRFVASQIGVVVIGGVRVAFAVEFEPGQQPASDDPGATSAPEVIEAILRVIGAQAW